MNTNQAYETLTAIAADLGVAVRLDRDEDAPLLFAAWCDEDIIGAGDTEHEAIVEACATLRGWQS